MKNTAYHILIALLLGIGFLSCSLEPEYYQGKDSDEAITDPIDAQAALTGAYSLWEIMPSADAMSLL